MPEYIPMLHLWLGAILKAKNTQSGEVGLFENAVNCVQPVLGNTKWW